jgi:hypothetical protein
MSNDIKKADFSRLPNWIKSRIKEFGVINSEEWIHVKIPALNNQSVIEILRLKNGEELLHDYFARLKGKFSK